MKKGFLKGRSFDPGQIMFFKGSKWNDLSIIFIMDKYPEPKKQGKMRYLYFHIDLMNSKHVSYHSYDRAEATTIQHFRYYFNPDRYQEMDIGQAKLEILLHSGKTIDQILEQTIQRALGKYEYNIKWYQKKIEENQNKAKRLLEVFQKAISDE